MSESSATEGGPSPPPVSSWSPVLPFMVLVRDSTRLRLLVDPVVPAAAAPPPPPLLLLRRCCWWVGVRAVG